jgi:hypothetical protein
MRSCPCERCKAVDNNIARGKWLDGSLPEAEPRMRGQVKLLSEAGLNKAYERYIYERYIVDSLYLSYSLRELMSRPMTGYVGPA